MGCSLLALGSSLSHLLNNFQREGSKCSILPSVLILFMTHTHALSFSHFFSCCWAWMVQGNPTTHSTLLMLSPYTHGFPSDSQNRDHSCDLNLEIMNLMPVMTAKHPWRGHSCWSWSTEELYSGFYPAQFSMRDWTSPDSFVSFDAATSELTTPRKPPKNTRNRSFP